MTLPSTQKQEIVLAAAQNAWDTVGSLTHKRDIARLSIEQHLAADKLEATREEIKEMQELAAASV